MSVEIIVLVILVVIVPWVVVLILVQVFSRREAQIQTFVNEYNSPLVKLVDIQQAIVALHDTVNTQNKKMQDTLSINEDIHLKVMQIQEILSHLNHNMKGLREQAIQPFQTIQRLDNILSGNPQAKGQLGENVVKAFLKNLPSEWIDRDVQFPNGEHVEFALRTPFGKYIPIDSKWVGEELLDRLANSQDKNEHKYLIREIQKAVFLNAQKVSKYIDPERTLNFCIAVVPDGVLEHCHVMSAHLIRYKVVLVGYSQLQSYIIFVMKSLYSTARMAHCADMAQQLQILQLEIEDKRKEFILQIEPLINHTKQKSSEIVEKRLLITQAEEYLKALLDNIQVADTNSIDFNSFDNALRKMKKSLDIEGITNELN